MPFTRILSLTVSLYLDKLKLKSELCLMTDPWAQLGCICLKCKTESILPTLGKKKKKNITQHPKFQVIRPYPSKLLMNLVC